MQEEDPTVVSLRWEVKGGSRTQGQNGGLEVDTDDHHVRL